MHPCAKRVCAYLGCTLCISLLLLIFAFLEAIDLFSERLCVNCFGPLDIRVTKGFGTRDYNQVRVSAISPNATPPFEGFFTYSARFRYKWTQNFIHSALMAVEPSKPNLPLSDLLGTQVWLPPRGAGVAGVLIADPCVDLESGKRWVVCKFGKKLNTLERIPALLNAFVADNSTDFWGILGDNFYDRSGEITADVFGRISIQVKSKILIAVAGNHDYWVGGNPMFSTTSDQCGNGFMQYYAQDAKAAIVSNRTPFDFRVDPDRGRPFNYKCNLPDITNFFWYNQIGNVGIIGQSGAYSLRHAKQLMVEACEWLGNQTDVKLALLVGHWDKPGMGAQATMAMPDFYKEMSSLPGCREFDSRGLLKFVVGHTHCNTPHPHKSQAGFRVAGFGMNGCGNFGMPILDTTDDRVRFWYFDTSSDALYKSVLECVLAKGWRQCTHLAVLWLDQPMQKSEYIV